MSIEKIKIHHTAKKNVILNPPNPIAATPEAAIISKGFSLGIPLRRIKGGWVEFDPKAKRWVVYKVCQH